MANVNNTGSETLLSSLSGQLAQIEKRDWELWLVVLVTCAVVGLGMLALLAPTTFLKGGQLRIELQVSKELFFALIAILVIFNLYVMSRKFELRRTRQKLVSVTVQNELTRLQSFIDPLTEVYNRRSLDDMATKYISRARRSKTALTFLIADVDRFKQINTKFGHLTGDLVLAEISAVLRSCIRGSDAVVRYGGDEFLLMLADAGARDAEVVVDRIEDAMEAWNRTGQLPGFEVTISVGSAEWKDGATLDETLDSADNDMYRRKEKTR